MDNDACVVNEICSLPTHSFENFLKENQQFFSDASDRKRIAVLVSEFLSDFPSWRGNAMRGGVRSRFLRLLGDIGELNANNSVSLWVRYFWETHIVPAINGAHCLPAALEIDLTAYCDSGCFFCKEGHEKRFVEYPFEKLERDLTEMAGTSPRPSMVIYSGGGEPTCYSRFSDALELTHRLDYDIYVSTHGGQIGLPSLPHEIFTAYCTVVKFSIGGASHKMYNRVHNRARDLVLGTPRTVDYVFKQCRLLSEKRRTVISLGVPIRLPRLFIAMTVSPVNQDEVLLMTERALEAGVDIVMFRPVISPCQHFLRIDEGIRQMGEARAKFGDKIEVLTFNHRLDYGYEREDYFGECVCHPTVTPEGFGTKKGSITPCIFRRGNRSEHAWLSGGEPCILPLKDILSSEGYRGRILEQNLTLHEAGHRRCPRCRKVPNNIFLDILKQASPEERQVIRNIILFLYPRNPLGEVLRGFH